MNKLTYKTLIYLIVINSFVSITNVFYPSSLPLGKILGGLLLINILVIYKESLKKSDLLLFIFIGSFFSLAILNSIEHNITIEHLMFFLSTVLLIWKIADKNIRQNLKIVLYSKQKMLDKYIKFSIILLVIGLFIPKCYQYVNGDNLYYGFAESGHKLAANICFITALTIFVYNKKSFKIHHLCYLVILFIVLLATGSRTYCFPEVVFLFVYYKLKLSNLKVKWIITPVIIISLAYLLFNSNVLDRFIAMGNNQYVSSNFWEAASSGRLIWWKIDINEFLGLSFLQQLIGKGFSYVYIINEQYYGLKINAHNDFLNVLLAVGWSGFIGYVEIIIRLIYKFKKQLVYRNDGDSILKICIVAFCILWNACISGFYGSQQYVFSFIILLIILDNDFRLGKEG